MYLCRGGHSWFQNDIILYVPHSMMPMHVDPQGILLYKYTEMIIYIKTMLYGITISHR